MSYAPTECRDSFTLGQKRRMKNALQLINELNATTLSNYTFIRGNSITCFDNNYYINSHNTTGLTIESSNNITVTMDNSSSTQIELTITNNNPGANEGEAAWIDVKRSGISEARKDFWIGVPPKIQPNSLTGPVSVYEDDLADYYSDKMEGAETYHWLFPSEEAVQTFPFNSVESDWQYDYVSTYNSYTRTMAGECSGEIAYYGINECGDGLEPNTGDGIDVDVVDGNPNCNPPPTPIVYYPNPADDLLDIDLSVEPYAPFVIKIFDGSQTVVLQQTSESVVKTISTSSLSNGTYYMHIYNSYSTLILDVILIINH